MSHSAASARRKMFSLLLLGFSSGLPFSLTGSTLQAWALGEKIDLELIGLYSLLGLPYALKLLWAPLFDMLPAGWLGRRRTAIAVLQVLVAGAILAMSLGSPADAPFRFIVIALILTTLSASQDIVIDAFRAESLREKELGEGVSMGVLGYRLGMVMSGAVALVLADHMSFESVYRLMAMGMVIGAFGTMLGSEPPQESPRVAWSSARGMLLEPITRLFQRDVGLTVLLFIALYRCGDVIAQAMTLPFLTDLGFSKSEIGVVQKLFGPLSTIVGALVGGFLMRRIALRDAVVWFGVFQAVSTLMYLLLSAAGKSPAIFATTVVVENFAGGMGTTAFLAVLIRLCDPKFTATHFAALTSLVALVRMQIESGTGFLARAVGWELFFLLAFAAALPGLYLATRVSEAWFDVDRRREERA